jgi:hypothetical protein
LNKIQEYKLQVFEKKMLRKIFVPAEDVSNLGYYIRRYFMIFSFHMVLLGHAFGILVEKPF